VVPQPLDDALAHIRALLLDPARLVRAVGAGRRRLTPEWRRVELRPVDLSSERRLQVVMYDQRQAFTRNLGYGEEAGREVDSLLAMPFGNWHVETVDSTVQIRVTKKGEAQVHHAQAQRETGVRPHDKAKPRMLEATEPLFAALGVTTTGGEVKPNRQDKYRQINEFLRALAPMLDAGELSNRPLRVVDLGCGNAYLTFAAYRYLSGPAGLDVELTGVDVKAQAREHNAKVAAELGWADRVHFVEGTIADAPVDGADIVLALHACDTATDDALARAVRWQAPIVLAAPCCHHDLQRQLRHAHAPSPYGMLTRHGILRERFADTLTDALRACLMRLVGYRVEVVEFVDSRHTPRNTLLRATRTGAPPSRALVDEYTQIVRAWGVTPALVRLLGAELDAAMGVALAPKSSST
jgi:SAM-dependent methyltransferase